MGRISTCNIIDNRKAHERVINCGASIVTEKHPGEHQADRWLTLTVTVNSQPIAERTFSNFDEEVMLNSQTAWLNKLADELEYWQSKS